VANCTKIIQRPQPNGEIKRMYMITLKHVAKYVVDLHKDVAPTDIEEGMRVGVEKNKYQI
jgi:26S proteasome regulatory subunit T1